MSPKSDLFPLLPDAIRRPEDERDRDGEDVHLNLMTELGQGRKHDSRLAWADFLRNVAVFDLVRQSEPTVLVDCGCGENLWLLRWIEQNGLDTMYFGLDGMKRRTDAVNRFGRGHADMRRAPRGVHHDCSQELPFAADTVGTVTCLEAMEHFCSSYTGVEAFLEEVHRVLMPTGRFVLATPNRAGGVLQHPNCHSWEASHEELLRMLRARFEVDTWWTYRAKPHVVRGMEKVSRQLGPGGEPLPLLPRALHDALIITETMGDEDQPPGNVLYLMTKRFGS